MALVRPRPMSAVWSQLGVKRTRVRQVKIDVNDQKRTYVASGGALHHENRVFQPQPKNSSIPLRYQGFPYTTPTASLS
jgi:hypothetical protein